MTWELKRLLMAEIDNEGDGDTPATLHSALESLNSGYKPYNDFPVDAVRTELETLTDERGPASLAASHVTADDWKRRAAE